MFHKALSPVLSLIHSSARSWGLSKVKATDSAGISTRNYPSSLCYPFSFLEHVAFTVFNRHQANSLPRSASEESVATRICGSWNKSEAPGHHLLCGGRLLYAGLWGTGGGGRVVVPVVLELRDKQRPAFSPETLDLGT